MKIGQINLNNSASFKGRKKKSASFSVNPKNESSKTKIELQVSRSDYRILPTGDLKCNHYREGKQIENSNFCEAIAVTPIDSNEDIFYNPSCDYSCDSSSDDSLKQIKLTSDDLKTYANLLSKQILNYALINKDLLCDLDYQNYFYTLLTNDFRILNNKSKAIIFKYVSLDNETREKNMKLIVIKCQKILWIKTIKFFINIVTSKKNFHLQKQMDKFMTTKI